MNDCYECISQYASQLVHGVRNRISTGQLQRKKLRKCMTGSLLFHDENSIVQMASGYH